MYLKKYINWLSWYRNSGYFHVVESRLLKSVVCLHSARPHFSCRENSWSSPDLSHSHPKPLNKPLAGNSRLRPSVTAGHIWPHQIVRIRLSQKVINYASLFCDELQAGTMVLPFRLISFNSLQHLEQLKPNKSGIFLPQSLANPRKTFIIYFPFGEFNSFQNMFYILFIKNTKKSEGL